HRPRTDAARSFAWNRARRADRNVSGGEWLLLHSQLRNTDRGDAVRPERHDADWEISAEPFVYASGSDHHSWGCRARVDIGENLFLKYETYTGGNCRRSAANRRESRGIGRDYSKRLGSYV